jgi:hypothetical protein
MAAIKAVMFPPLQKSANTGRSKLLWGLFALDDRPSTHRSWQRLGVLSQDLAAQVFLICRRQSNRCRHVGVLP